MSTRVRILIALTIGLLSGAICGVYHLLCLVPQRTFYDQLLVFGVPRSRRSLMILVFTSWLCYIGWASFPSPAIPWHILLIYLPALVIVFLETRGTIEQ